MFMRQGVSNPKNVDESIQITTTNEGNLTNELVGHNKKAISLYS